MPDNILKADSHGALVAQLAEVDIDVPERWNGRTTRHVERHGIVHLLGTLPSERLSFPLVLVHDDRPDFRLTMASGTVGIEHTEAVPPNVASADAMRGRGLGPDVHFTPRALPGEPAKTAAELRGEILADDPGDGWVGDGPEREWAEAMAHHVREKLKKVNAAGFTRYPTNWLIVYDNWPLPNVDRADAAPRLAALLTAMGAFSFFDAIFVQDGSTLIEFGRNYVRHVQITPRA